MRSREFALFYFCAAADLEVRGCSSTLYGKLVTNLRRIIKIRSARLERELSARELRNNSLIFNYVFFEILGSLWNVISRGVVVVSSVAWTLHNVLLICILLYCKNFLAPVLCLPLTISFFKSILITIRISMRYIARPSLSPPSPLSNPSWLERATPTSELLLSYPWFYDQPTLEPVLSYFCIVAVTTFLDHV